MPTSPHTTYGLAVSAVSRFDELLASALGELTTATGHINALPGVTLDPKIAKQIDALHSAAGAVRLAPYLNETVRPAFKAAALS